MRSALSVPATATNGFAPPLGVHGHMDGLQMGMGGAMGAIGVGVFWECPPAALGGHALAPVDKSLEMPGSKGPHGAQSLA